MLFGLGKKAKSIKSREKAEIRCFLGRVRKKKASNPERKPVIDAFQSDSDECVRGHAENIG